MNVITKDWRNTEKTKGLEEALGTTRRSDELKEAGSMAHLPVSNCTALPPPCSLVQLPVRNNPEADAPLVLHLRPVIVYV